MGGSIWLQKCFKIINRQNAGVNWREITLSDISLGWSKHLSRVALVQVCQGIKENGLKRQFEFIIKTWNGDKVMYIRQHFQWQRNATVLLQRSSWKTRMAWLFSFWWVKLIHTWNYPICTTPSPRPTGWRRRKERMSERQRPNHRDLWFLLRI